MLRDGTHLGTILTPLDALYGGGELPGPNALSSLHHPQLHRVVG